MKRIVLILTGLSGLIMADFTQIDEIVIDNTTKLMWQNEPYTIEEESAYTLGAEEGKVLFWESAITYCNELSLNGFDDWRLPNIIELTSIVDDTTSNPAIPTVFVDTKSEYFWSSTIGATDNSYASEVHFYYGNSSEQLKTKSCYVRCVR
jgi:Protein of unknown function (DUF1566)